MYILHIANKNYSSWSLRPWVLMTELGIPFQETLHLFQSGSNWEAFRKFSPNGLVPCLIDNKQVVWDSLAIVEYLAEEYSNVWPSDKTARAWARSASAEMHSGFVPLRSTCPMTCGVRIELKEQSPALLKNIARLEELWLEGFTKFGGPFLAGQHFTAVDAFFAPVVFRINSYGLKISQKAQAYVDLMLALPSMQTWYQQALLETKEPGHEADMLNVGTITADFRQS